MDLAGFLHIFFAESEENLDELERGLLDVESAGETGPERVDRLFRAAHTLKGNSATFGFSEIVGLAHSMEALLDRVRSGTMSLASVQIDLLLKATDALRKSVVARRDGCGPPAELKELQAALEAGLASGEGREPEGWLIRFRPHSHLLQKGNDVVLMFRMLDGLGNLQARPDTTRLPNLRSFRPEDCYLSWELSLTGKVPPDLIREAFEWVEGDCELEIQPLPPLAPAPAASPQTSAPDARADLQETQIPRAPATAPLAASKEPAPRSSPQAEDLRFIRVPAPKIEQLINMMGEMVITQSMLNRQATDLGCGTLQETLERLERNTRELQESVLQIRMVPVDFAFQRIPRLVRDLSAELGKKIQCRIHGGDAELDKDLLDKIADPLVHLVRNCVDHGLEAPTQRLSAGKPEVGKLEVAAYHHSGSLVVQVEDDGKGIDPERLRERALQMGIPIPESSDALLELIFLPGLSTAPSVSEVSGRGVGMDIVRRNLLEIGGSVTVSSRPGLGTRFLMSVPLTLTILEGQLIRVGAEVFVVPLFSVVECLQLRESQLRSLGSEAALLRHQDRYIPVLDLGRALGVAAGGSERPLGMVVEWSGRRMVFRIDALLDQQQVVVKTLDKNFRRIDGILGATIMTDGSVALILDVAGLLQSSRPASSRETARMFSW
ncbi:MAG: chemotaxis protein CheA [Armatimonadetes bacterium]|nr:chemotaxis protein CheA [Armatimonadota bacterium]